MADLQRRRNEELARILHQLGWSPERLAREVSLALPPGLAISSTAPYKWRDRGMVPRSPHDQAVCEVLSRTLGIAVTYEQLWGRMGGHRGAKILSPGLLTDAWTADTAQTALREAATDAGPVRLTDLFRSADLDQAAERLSTPPPPVGGGEGALRVDPALVGDLGLSYRSKQRLERSCGGGLVLGPTRAELAMLAKLLELGAYDERLGRELYGTASRFARLAGWAAYDLGHDAAAQRAFVAALRAAHVSGDVRLGVAVLGALVVLATQGAGGRGLDAVSALSAALDSHGEALSPGGRARQLGRIARAHGRRGEAEPAEDAAARAFAELDGVPGAEEARACLAGMVGEARLALGRHRMAKAQLAEAVAGLGPGRARTKALLMVRLAETHRRLGDRREAARTAELARALAAGMQSERLARALRDFDAAGRVGA
ncbi:hypothetical protein [Streptomyces rubellomurinus]|uniref:Transcriptional regulator n=2 Tax=Streptomyces TaxID=1883 RepID=A0A0F2TI16_STRR3|nr:hypothetical protein [Streptomyces rubellomurinus]KJS53865.1 hypothetical protein VM98_22705 [Streptomyces rubellomurinus subsp. indigoferus]KJS61362.1 hypothetical protein VM95_15225 [Streptomyces rubellomurinus]